MFWTNEAEFLARNSTCTPLHAAWNVLFFFPIAITFNILLEAHPRQVNSFFPPPPIRKSMTRNSSHPVWFISLFPQWGIMTVTCMWSWATTLINDHYGYFRYIDRYYVCCYSLYSPQLLSSSSSSSYNVTLHTRTETITVISAFGVGLLGNLHSIVSGHPAIIPIISGFQQNLLLFFFFFFLVAPPSVLIVI